MALRLGELLGFPVSGPDLVYDIAVFRWALVLLAVAWAALSLRSRSPLVLLGGIAYAAAAVGWWTLALGRPYGLLLDPDTTRWAAQVSITAATGNPSESFLSGEPAIANIWTRLAALGAPGDVVLLLPSLVPVAILPMVAIAIWSLWGDRKHSLLAACLWLGFSTGSLDALRGAGFVSSAWKHPEAVLTFVPLVSAILMAGRLLQHSRLGLPVCAVLAALWALFPGAASPIGLSSSLLLLTFDQGPWLVLALLGARRGLDAATKALMGVGGLLVIACALPLGIDCWGAHALYRLGLILAATRFLQDVATEATQTLIRNRLPRTFAAERVGMAVLLLLFVPGSLLTWWDPPRLDPTAKASLEPLSTNLRAAMERIRQETSADGVFLASPPYAPHVASLAGRRVLLAPTLVVEPADLERRRRAEQLVLSGADPGRLGERYGLRYVLITPGDFRQYGIEDPSDLIWRGSFRLLFAAQGGFYVYEIATREEMPAG